MLDLLDKKILLDSLLPTLENVSMKEPGVLMAMLGKYAHNIGE